MPAFPITKPARQRPPLYEAHLDELYKQCYFLIEAADSSPKYGVNSDEVAAVAKQLLRISALMVRAHEKGTYEDEQ